LPISDHLYYGGSLRQPRSPRSITVLNPATGEPLGTIPEASADDVAAAVEQAAAAAAEWAATPPRSRGVLLAKLAAALRANAEKLARLDSADSGRILSETRAQVERSAQQLEYCAGMADKLEGRVVPLGGNQFATTVLEPYGVVGALTPWNAPLLQISQKVSHAAAGGNTAVVKPSPLACFTALEFAVLAGEVGFPPGVINVVTGDIEAGEALVENPDVGKITFTGSIATGRKIAAACGARGASVSLELGGKCPLLVFSDADLERAACEAGRAALASTGQSCVSAARILVEDSCFDAFLDLFVEEARRYVGGDPLAEGTVMGPLISARAWQHVRDLVEDAVAMGARVPHGDLPSADGPSGGFFMNSLVLSDVPEQARITREEIFGPVTCLERFSDDQEAVAKANAGPYGLAAGVFSGSNGRARRMLRDLKAGNVWLNCYKALDPALPFGGDKASGINRECGIDGMLSFVKPKTLVEAF
jgi:acyl-CoA reductase-like NAD-dependent aldehyde dehydrogenase